MSSFYILVLVPADKSGDEAYDAARALLYPYMIGGVRGEPQPSGKFDWFLQPDDLDDEAQHVWRASEVSGRLAELEVEAILTPDGRWHEIEGGPLGADEAWLARARQILQQQKGCLALRHLLHI